MQTFKQFLETKTFKLLGKETAEQDALIEEAVELMQETPEGSVKILLNLKTRNHGQ